MKLPNERKSSWISRKPPLQSLTAGLLCSPPTSAPLRLSKQSKPAAWTTLARKTGCTGKRTIPAWFAKTTKRKVKHNVRHHRFEQPRSLLRHSYRGRSLRQHSDVPCPLHHPGY